MRRAWNVAADKADLKPSLIFIGSILAMIGVAYLAGQLVALPLFVAGYLLIWGNYKWTTVAIYSSAALLIVWGFYGQLMRLLFHPSMLFG